MKLSRGRELLTDNQRNELMQIPKDDWILGTYYTFSEQDLAIILKRRREDNRLGFAVQLAVLRYPGWSYTHLKSIPHSVIQYIAQQINVPAAAIHSYGQRENTLWDHLKEIRKAYGYQEFTSKEYRQLSKHLLPLALENGDSMYLLNACFDYLRQQKIIFPALTTLERVVWETRDRAEERIFNQIYYALTPTQIEKLETLVVPASATESNKTPLGWLKEPMGFPSPDTFLKVIERLEFIRDMALNDRSLHTIHRNRLSQLARLGTRYEPYAFRNFKENKRYAILVVYLLQLAQELTDKAFEIHDRQILSLLSKGRKAQEEIQRKNGKKLNEKIIHFTNIGQALIKAKQENLNVFDVLESVLEWDTFVTSIEEAKELARPSDYDYLDLLQKRFYALRKYTPTLLRVLDFRSTKANEPLLEAVELLREMNDAGKRKVPIDAPINFISARWKKHLYEEDGSINRHYYEMAVLTELREHVRAGDISIEGSKQYRDFEEYLFTAEQWQADKQQTRLAVPIAYEEYLQERIASLEERLKWLTTNLKDLDGVSLEKGRLSLARLEKDIPAEAQAYSANLYKLLPRIKLTDLLMDIAYLTGFHEQFTHASSNRKPDKEETVLLMAALIGMGTNIGLSKMADATPGVTYKQLANVAHWRMHEDAMNRAQATLVNYQHRLKMSSYWGDGTTSSSDGMRMQVSVSSLHAEANPHYGTGKGTTIYRFTSDQFSSYYTKIIHTNSRDAIHVLDGLLHHETDLMIEEHYTDTAGYTDQIFGLTHLLGFKFAPRIRDLSDAKLFTFKQTKEYPKLNALLRGQINTKIIQENYEECLRLAHSLREGTVSASLIMGKLGSYARQNSLATALREMGRIEKTIFILNYISDESLRRKIQKGLNKGEAMNALARAIFFGKQGELRERTMQHQLQRASALNIIINAISVWNTIYLTEALEHQKNQGHFKEELLPHISPLGWEHINFLGEYHFRSESSHNPKELRPLRIP